MKLQIANETLRLLCFCLTRRRCGCSVDSRYEIEQIGKIYEFLNILSAKDFGLSTGHHVVGSYIITLTDTKLSMYCRIKTCSASFERSLLLG